MGRRVCEKRSIILACLSPLFHVHSVSCVDVTASAVGGKTIHRRRYLVTANTIINRPYTNSSRCQPQQQKVSDIKLETTPHDVRFPNTNQAQHCWTRYNEYVVCLYKHDGDEAHCRKLRQLASSICPNANMTKWDEERTNGNFAGVQPPSSHGHGHGGKH